MGKRILVLLLSSALLFGGMTENIAATEISAENNIATEAIEETEELTEESEQEDLLERQGFLEQQEPESEESEESGTRERHSGFMPTGYRKPVRVDLRPEDITEIYDESETQSLIKGSAKYRAVWDSYSTNYYYNLLSQPEKNLWDQLDNMCYGYLMGTESLTRRGTDCYWAKAVLYDSGNITSKQAWDVMYLFYLSNPQYYFLEATMGIQYGCVQM